MLMPKRTKFRRPHRVSYEGKAKGAKTIEFGEYGLQATSGNWITSQQIEAARIAMTRYMKRAGNVWIRIFPHMAYTKKPRSEEHTSELQSRENLVCRLLLDKKKIER